jgi:hypothetical protein
MLHAALLAEGRSQESQLPEMRMRRMRSSTLLTLNAAAARTLLGTSQNSTSIGTPICWATGVQMSTA